MIDRLEWNNSKIEMVRETRNINVLECLSYDNSCWTRMWVYHNPICTKQLKESLSSLSVIY